MWRLMIHHGLRPMLGRKKNALPPTAVSGTKSRSSSRLYLDHSLKKKRLVQKSAGFLAAQGLSQEMQGSEPSGLLLTET